MKSDFLFLCSLCVASLLLSLGINTLRSSPLPLVYQTKEQRMQANVQHINSAPLSDDKKAAAEARIIEYAELKRTIAEGKAILLDARPAIFHQMGHIPGALSLPRVEFEQGYAVLKEQLEKDKNQHLVVYCSGPTCEDSGLVSQALIKLGYTNLSIYKGGWSEWTEKEKDNAK